MQRSLDSYFKKSPAISANKKSHNDTNTPEKSKKRKAVIISSDEEDEIAPSPSVAKANDRKIRKTETSEGTRKLNNTSSSDKKPSLSKLKKIDPSEVFGTEIKRIERKKPAKPKDAAIIELEDDDIDRSLMEVDITEVLGNGVLDKKERQSKTPKKEQKEEKSHRRTPRKSPHHNGDLMSLQKTPNEKAASSLRSRSSSAKKSAHKHSTRGKSQERDDVEAGKLLGSAKKAKRQLAVDTPKSIKKPKMQEDDEAGTAETRTPKSGKKSKAAHHTPQPRDGHADHDSSVLSDEERHERKRMAAILYQKFKNRSSCLNHGCKEVPKGAPNCLSGLTFLVTGVLESLERDEANSIIKEYGGKTMTTVGKRLNYLIVGEDAGLKKLAQADEFGVKILSEDGLFDLIRERSKEGGASKPEAKTPTGKGVKKESKMNNSLKREDVDQGIKIKTEKTPKKTVKKENAAPELNNNQDQVKIKQEASEAPAGEVKTDAASQEKLASMAWVDKYKPASVKEIIGQQGAASNVVKLTNWLSKWYTNHDGKKKLQRPNPWAKNDDGSFYKAALLSGPPGIGKTTTANLVCKELGYDIVEFNASDTRSKRLLKEEVSELLSNKSLYGFCHGQGQAMTKKHVLIMDEVDGMAGNEDRGGIQELISLIKESSVPIICMCNDRNHQKMRSLVNYCYDLRFNKPRLEQIKGRLMSICFREKMKMEPAKLEEIIAATNNDIRQSINQVALLSGGKDLNLDAKKEEKTAQKDMKMGPWDVVRKVFSADEHKNMSIYDKCDLFFNDYSMAPLFVQQNYLIVEPKGPKSEILAKVAKTADSLSLGDMVDKRIRSNNVWSLLPAQAVFSSLLPGEYMSGHFKGQINFPGWLGKYSKTNKRSRLAQEIHDHTRVCTSGSKQSVRLDYAPFLIDAIVRPLKEKGMDGVEESLQVMKEYHLLREDIDSLIELTTWPGKKSPMDAVDGRVKAALTRAYNKEVMPYSYSVMAGVKKKRAEASDDTEILGVEDEEGDNGGAVNSEDEKDDDNLENDGLIKTKKPPASSGARTTKAKSGTTAGSKKSASTSSKSKAKK